MRLVKCVFSALFILGGCAATNTNTAPAGPEDFHTSKVQRGCQPECSADHVCVKGECVSVCNPPCSGGLYCGEDRVCH